MNVTPVPAPKVLDTFFLEARCKLLDLAAILDRIGRGDDSSRAETDTRMDKIHRALEILRDSQGERAERIQKLFSLDYDSSWKRPQPR